MNNDVETYRQGLLIQIREAYGRLVYTYTTQLKQVAYLIDKHKMIKYSQIILSSISTGGILVSVISDSIIMTWVSGLVSTLLLALNLLVKESNLAEEIARHRKTAADLWSIREIYISLLTDFDILTEEQLRCWRDKLQEETALIYRNAPSTNAKSYKKAQQALKKEEEQFFRAEEIDRILPEHLRNKD